MLKIGLVGKPNVGKSTLFSALTRNQVEIANYPFTTLKPNVGITFVRVPCPHVALGRECNPREGFCSNGIRHVPVEVIDVPGLIPGASQGKGMGNEFMDNIRDSEALCHIIDASGMTAPDGTPVQERRDPADDVGIIEGEIIQWFSDRLYRDWEKYARKADSAGERVDHSLAKKLASFGFSEKQVALVLSKGVFPAKLSLWSESDAREFSKIVFEHVKPIFRLANKADRMPENLFTDLADKIGRIYFVSGEYELALEKAREAKIIDSIEENFRISERASSQQKNALETIRSFFSDKRITRIMDITGDIVMKALGYVIVFPVVDESTWEDNKSNVLPDALTLPAGSTALDLAFKIHTDIGEGFIRAIDCRTKRVIGKDHVLQNSDVIRIVAKTR